MFCAPALGSLLAVHSNNVMAHVGLQMRNSLIDAIYRKSLRLSPAARQSASTGQIVNMFSADTRQLQAFLFFLNNCVAAPFQIVAALVLIYYQVGYSMFVGVAMMIVIAPLNVGFFQTMAALRRKKLFITDSRVNLMNEILAGIRIIKYYAWELAFETKITGIRAQELLILKYIAYVVAFGFTLVFLSVPIIQPVLVFYTYTRLGNDLTAATAFTTIAYFNIMQLPFAFLPMGLAQYSQSLVSTKRLADYFSQEELDPYLIRDKEEYNDKVKAANQEDKDGSTAGIIADDVIIAMHKADLFWLNIDQRGKDDSNAVIITHGSELLLRKDQDESDAYKIQDHVLSDPTPGDVILYREPVLNRSAYTLMNMNLQIKKGMLVAVAGSVGCGKSSFLAALLGELNLRKKNESSQQDNLDGVDISTSGSVYVEKGTSIAYCNQQPWVLNDTVKGNILFGDEYDEERFDRAVHAANLEDDIRVLQGGVETEIGEKGINLSGGQKARVQLARAVYKQADLYLLDDPLSAVDAHVGEHLFNECILKELKGKTRVLVTHHVHLLPQCDYIIILEDGKIKANGTYNELSHSGIDLHNIMNTSQAGGDDEESIVVVDQVEVDVRSSTNKDMRSMSRDSQDSGASTRKSRKQRSSSEASTGSTSKMVEKAELSVAQSKAEERHKDTRTSKLTTLEERKLGDVQSQTYFYYLRAGGALWIFGALLWQTGGQGIEIFSKFWLTMWAAESVEKEEDGEVMTSSRNLYYINYYATFAMLSLACYFFRSLLMAQHRVKSAAVLHMDLLRSITSAPVWFFDVTPLGRILNRFSSDMSIVDEDLTQTINQLINSMYACFGAAAAICAATKGTFGIMLIFLIYFYYQVSIVSTTRLSLLRR